MKMTLTVRKLTVRAVAAPMPLPLQTASGAVSTALLVLIDLETSAGITGRAYLQSYTKASLQPIVDLVKAMGEMIEGDALAPFEIEAKLRQKFKLLGVHNIVLFAIAGIDMAVWDALAQGANLPLVTMLGGRPKPIRAYNSKGLGIMPVAKLAKEAKALLKEGFSAVKLRLGRPDPKEDVAALRAVKKAIGDDVTLMCDYNQALTVNDAILRGRMLDGEGGLHWIEEPTRADDFAGNRRIADALDTPVQIGENFMGPEQMAQALSRGACDYVMPDAQRIGGVTGWMRAAALAQGAGMEMSSHLFPEISVHLLGVTPTAHWLEYVDWAAPILAEPLSAKDGFIAIPDVPGSGIHWNEKAVAKYAI
jgi:mandelate racemase